MVLRAISANNLLQVFFAEVYFVYYKVVPRIISVGGKIQTVLSPTLLQKKLKFFRNKLKRKLRAKPIASSWTDVCISDVDGRVRFRVEILESLEMNVSNCITKQLYLNIKQYAL